MEAKVILEAVNRLLKGVEVRHEDPAEAGVIKMIKEVVADEESNELKVIMEDGTWAHSDFIYIYR